MPIAGADTTLSSMPARECRADSKGFHMTLALAIDLGGTKVEAALVDDTGHIVTGSRTREATGAAAAADRAVLERAVASVIARCRALPEWAEVTAAGIGSAGPIDLAAGTVAPMADILIWPCRMRSTIRAKRPVW